MNLVASLITPPAQASRVDRLPVLKAATIGNNNLIDNPLVVQKRAQGQSPVGDANASTSVKIRAFPTRGFKPDRTLEKTLHPSIYGKLSEAEHIAFNREKLFRRTWNTDSVPYGELSPYTMRVRGQVSPVVRGAGAALPKTRTMY
jgi:hypothetical protein